MTDPTKDIDALLDALTPSASGFGNVEMHRTDALRFRAALTALIAERDKLAYDLKWREGECDNMREIQGNAARRIQDLERQLEANPPADRDRDLRKDLICAIWPELLRIFEKTDTTGANWDLVRINARAQALREADAMIAEMRKEESDA